VSLTCCADGDGFRVSGKEYRIAEVDAPEADQVDYNGDLVTTKDSIMGGSATSLLCRQVGISYDRIVVQVWTTTANLGGSLEFHSVAKALVAAGVARYAPFRKGIATDIRSTQQNKEQMLEASRKAEEEKRGMFAYQKTPTLKEIEQFREAKRKKAQEGKAAEEDDVSETHDASRAQNGQKPQTSESKS
jgi:endonuclease YncB( thermonuclease family)